MISILDKLNLYELLMLCAANEFWYAMQRLLSWLDLAEAGEAAGAAWDGGKEE